MKFFGINIGQVKAAEMRITPEDRDWVVANFKWLISAFGHPLSEQMTISEKYFPKTFQTKEIKIENLIADCCTHLELDPQLFTYEIFEDIRDTENMPYAIADAPIDCFLNIDKQEGKYSIALAKTIFKHPHWLIASVCIEFGRAKFHYSKLDFGEGEETDLFLYLAAVYFGYGVILADNLAHTGEIRNAVWETKWAFIAKLPSPVLAYALAVIARLTGNQDPVWKELLPKEIRDEFDLAIAHIDESQNELFGIEKNRKAIQIETLFKQADKHYTSAEYKEGVLLLQQALSLAGEDLIKANLLNTIGYYLLRDKKYRNSISHFVNALMLIPDYGYANDNLGFAFIMLGELDKGKEYLEKAVKTDNNDDAYSFRNMALYFQKKGDMISAEAHFRKAFDMQTKVDLLDFFYGLFLMEIGDKQKAETHFQKSADEGEYEGLEKMKTIKSG